MIDRGERRERNLPYKGKEEKGERPTMDQTRGENTLHIKERQGKRRGGRGKRSGITPRGKRKHLFIFEEGEKGRGEF